MNTTAAGRSCLNDPDKRKELRRDRSAISRDPVSERLLRTYRALTAFLRDANSVHGSTWETIDPERETFWKPTAQLAGRSTPPDPFYGRIVKD
jgi:hypothetical protein